MAPEKKSASETQETSGKTERVHIALEPAELTAIDDYRFAARIPTRSEAIRRLIQAGLKAAKVKQG
jgi:metal-responsive CopG/Arc/MetJ family transcriptional regulator